MLLISGSVVILWTEANNVGINDTSSECMKVTCGVPQGSILGPALFILYINDINDMCKVSMLIKSIVFADDTNFFYSGDNLSRVLKLYQLNWTNYIVDFKSISFR